MIRKFVMLCVLKLMVSISFAAGAGADVSLLSNGRFDKDGGNWPADWPHPEGATWEKEGDFHFLRLQSTEPGKMIMAYRQITLPAVHPPALELRVRVRAQDIKPGEKSWFDGRIILDFKDKDGHPLKPQPSAPNFKGTTKGWEDKSIFFPVPEAAAVLDIMPCLFQVAQGTMDLAQCEIFPATKEQLPPPPPMIPSETMVPEKSAKLPPPLHVAGNQLQTPDGKTVWLQGLCVDSMQWNAGGEHILQSIPVAIDQWHANVIRLPVKENFWFGWGPWQKKGDNGMTYRKLVDAAVEAAASRGAYLVLDLHQFGAPTENHVAFWKDAALRYKNHPAVLFELFNEPHSMSWKVWKDGGSLKSAENDHKDAGVKENNEAMSGDKTPGMQALVDAVRATGAKNLIIAGGLDWGYDLSGVVTDYALKDHDGGNGIMYSSHIYPWKKDWQHNTLDAAAKYPVFIGETGNPSSWEDFKFIPEAERYEPVGVESAWPPDMIALIQKYKLNWTGFSFHPKCGPQVILDWNYTPTPYWGTFVKDALAGKQFELKKIR
ncbi:MAG: glycoside hydrolase family 5 protein [Chthoniobacteraceae bacterium]